MARVSSDALVIFGATGDLAFKKIFPALHQMVKRGRLDAPVVTVGREPGNAMRIHDRARKSIETHGGGIDPAAFEKLAQRLSYVGGDYAEAATFAAIRAALGAARHPTFYLAIPPSAFATVVRGLARSGCADARSRPNGFSSTTRPPSALPVRARPWITSSNALGGIAR